MEEDVKDGNGPEAQTLGRAVASLSLPPGPVAAPAVTPPAQATAEDLVKAAQPLVQAYFDHQQRMQDRELGFDETIASIESSRFKWLMIGATVIGAIVMIFAGYLVLAGREATAIDLIKLVVALVGAGLGGYGLGVRKRRRQDADE